MAPSIVFLMYHELELPARKLVQSEPGYTRYILSETAFRSQIEWLRQQGWRGLNVSEALRYPAGKSVAITFDDGCETDLITAAPILRHAGFHATFYVTAGFLDRPGFMTRRQLCQLNSQGFEIGCHSMTHAYLNDITPEAQEIEIVAAREKLQEILGGPVEHFSCPGGRFDEHTLRIAERAGYRSVANSHMHANSPSTNPYLLGRIAIMRDTPLSAFSRACSGSGLWKGRLSAATRALAKNVLGNSLYERARAQLLGGK
jgi:peptidoglycan/xylan/chitin deacetylase (PgdA/CDA1 family)